MELYTCTVARRAPLVPQRSSINQMLTRLHQDLMGNIIRYKTLFNQAARKIKTQLVPLMEKPISISLKPISTSSLKILILFDAHRINQGLVAITQINTCPNWSFGDGLIQTKYGFKLRGKRKWLIFNTKSNARIFGVMVA